MAGIATPVRPAARDAERVEGGRAWVRGEQPPTGAELTAAGVVFPVEIGLVQGSAANRYARECAETYADLKPEAPESRRDPDYTTVNQMQTDRQAAAKK